MDDVARHAAYLALRGLLASYRAKLAVSEKYDKKSALGYYSLEHVAKSGRAQFAIVFAHRADVRLYLLPLRVFPQIAKRIPASLAKKVVSRSVLVFKAPPTTGELNAVGRVLVEAHNLVARRQTVAPTLPYTKPMTVKHVFDTLRRRLPPGLVALVGKQVHVTIPATTRVPASLKKERTNATTLAFKAVTWEQLQALDRCVARR